MFHWGRTKVAERQRRQQKAGRRNKLIISSPEGVLHQYPITLFIFFLLISHPHPFLYSPTLHPNPLFFFDFISHVKELLWELQQEEAAYDKIFEKQSEVEWSQNIQLKEGCCWTEREEIVSCILFEVVTYTCSVIQVLYNGGQRIPGCSPNPHWPKGSRPSRTTAHHSQGKGLRCILSWFQLGRPLYLQSTQKQLNHFKDRMFYFQ